MQDHEILAFQPGQVVPVEPEQFAFALQLGSAASTYRMPMKSPASTGLRLKLPGGKVQDIRFTDVPENRLLFAICDHFGSDHKTFMSVMLRFFALRCLWGDERMKKWVRQVEGEPGAVEVNEAVLVAAATFPVGAEGFFDGNAFFERVEEVARTIDAGKAATGARSGSSKP